MLPAPSGYQPGSPRQRAVSITLSACIILIALLLALLQTQVKPAPEARQVTTTFDVEGRPAGGATPEKRKQKAARKQPEPRARERPVPQPPQPRPIEQPKIEDPLEPAFIRLSRRDFAAGDIGGMRASGAAGGARGNDNAAAAYGPGEGPGGVQLYDAEWYRKPTDAQLATYMPQNAPREGWGLIACRTVENYRVEDCQILGESPRGSGFGRAVQNAAWQFLVLPPRINSKPQIGTWVRIRITYEGRSAG
ncbi:hypothetical protein [Novosphingobium album (ex Liu et al. 2023)]|uniref:Energy transducer TonB n=1 Tax=Novosphingobium album (ex Liu et al. 2023) TaxID=3031130 RepID=A0ABT5WTP7_9SPHN|nr:hypothetical protein [Novosphingobium album (ex Liu et al. 2023)]MDE8653260.1 hypothetical protein [Novosphingobium album (ex Liu et al. 2023)]